MKEVELRKDHRVLDKKGELLETDREEMQRKWAELDEERTKFEEQHRIIRQTSEKLSLERDKVMYDKAAYEAEFEAHHKQK